MRSQKLKDIYYASIGKLSIFPYFWHKARHPSKFYGAFVNIGCGPKNVAGMINIDGNILYKKDIWLDVTLGLPFPDSSLKGIYVSHVLEHFSPKQLRNLLAEFYRVLQPGGGVRIVVPSLEYAVQAYQEGQGERFSDWPEKYTSLGGRLNNFLLCANQHRLMFDFDFLAEFLRGAGFPEILRIGPLCSQIFGSEHLQQEADPALLKTSLYVEAIKK
jgi:predicted SAM-dependent methyltransferase